MKSGYFREYEIKLTTSDFRADAKKEVRRWHGWDADTAQSSYKTRHKHTELAAGDVRGPAQFWFVAPSGIIPENGLPSWAGLITAEYDQRWRQIVLTETKRAPRLHRTKIDEAFRHDLLTTFYFRFQRLFLKRPENENETQEKSVVDIDARQHQTEIESDQSEGQKDLAKALAEN